MSQSMADRFMEALQESEQTRNPEPLVALFADDGEATSLGHTEPLTGRSGVERFWNDYLNAFAEIHSDFTSVFEAEEGAVLEWVSHGRLRNGEPVSYRGVSVLELDGDRVRRFRTYYDSAVFMPLGARHASDAGRSG